MVYRTAAIGPDDVVALPDGRRFTSRMRTVLDLSRTEPDLSIRSMIEQARSDGAHTIDDFVRIAEPWRSPQRPWLRDFIGRLADCLPGGAAESHEEMLLGTALVAEVGWITTRIGPAAFGPAFAETIDRVVGVYRSLLQ